MVAITTLVAPSGECYEVNAGVVTLQCNNYGELLTMGRYTNPACFTFFTTEQNVALTINTNTAEK